jgi:hypothetical protein
MVPILKAQSHTNNEPKKQLCQLSHIDKRGIVPQNNNNNNNK